MAILNLQEDGRIQMLYNKWWKSSSQCVRDDKADQKASALGVENVGGIFVFLIGGLSVAILVAVMEFVWNSKTNAVEDKVIVLLMYVNALYYSSSMTTRYISKGQVCKRLIYTH